VSKILTSAVHPLALRSALSSILATVETPRGPTAKVLRPLIREVAIAGHGWARSFLGGMTKTAFKIGSYDVEEDLDKMLDTLKANKAERSYVKTTLPHGGPRIVHGHNRTVARTATMNIYCKSSLKEYKEDGLTHVRRMEVHDDRTSPICRVLNGTIHRIDKLLGYDLPQSHDSHPNCRGTFVPFFDVGGYKPIHREIATKINFLKYENAPREFEPWLRGINKHITFSKVIFVPKLQEKAKVEGSILFLNILDETDPRDLILEEEAKKVFDPKKFRELEKMTDAGLIHPEKTHETPLEHFSHLFVAYKLNQLEDPVIYRWFKNNKL
jgi:SPP1 gp7 family putative phage head morphogenesis protein